MSAHDELQQKIHDALDGNMMTVEQATDAVMRLIYLVGATEDEVEMTGFGDVRLQIQRQHWLTATFFNGVEHFEMDRACSHCGGSPGGGAMSP